MAIDTNPGRGREQVNDMATTLVDNYVPPAETLSLLDARLPRYDVALTEHLATPQTLVLAKDHGSLPGWLLLGEVPDREVVFGAVGTFWKADIEWKEDVAADQFATFAEPGWGKVACHLLVRPDGPGRSILSYECRTATTDPVSHARMSRYWWLIRTFVSYVLRAVLRTIRGNVDTHA
jgi:hypothetical protein